MKKKELIFTIVNVGFADEVMEKARKCGVKGGTIIHGRGTAKKDAEQFFDISFSGEKEIVMMVIDSDIKDQVLKAIYDGVGLETWGQGIAFSFPVDASVGLVEQLSKKKDESTK